jgi:PAS domain S-box-containing protein
VEFVAPADVEKLAAYHREILKPDGWVPATYSFGFIDRAGTMTPSTISVRKIPDTRRVIAAITDNTVQKKLEDLLRTNEEETRKIVDSLPVGIYRVRLEHPGALIWANPATVRMFGYDSLSDFLKQDIAGLYADPANRERFQDELKLTGQVNNFEVQVKKRDGTLFWVRITAVPRKNRDGLVEWVDGILENIDACRVAVQTCEQDNRYLRGVLESAVTVAIICTDESGTITFFTRGAEQMLGYSADELIGKQTPFLFHPESEITARSRLLSEETGDLITGFEIFTHPLETQRSDEREWTWIRKDKTNISVYLTVAPLRTETGTRSGFLFAAKEITSMKRLEEAFMTANLQMSGVIYNLPDATFAIDQNGRVIAWNRAMEDLTGIKAVDILGRGNYEYALPFYGSRRPMLIDLISSADAKIQEWGYSAIRRKGNAVTAESPARDESNRLRVLWSIAAPIFDAAGELAGCIESLSDITERRMKETVLEDTVLKFREILENTGSATAIIEEEGTISYINPEFGRILGLVRDEIEGKKKWMEFVVPEDVRALQKYWDKEGLQGDGPVRYEVRFIRWDGEVRTGFLTINRIPGTQKVVVTILDITDKIRAETAVQMANRKLNFLNGIIRHDILNQLTVLKANLEMTREQNTDPGQGAVLDKEIGATDAIQSLITFTRDYQDIGIAPPEWQDVKKTVLKSCAGIQLGEITLSVEIEGVEIYADRLLSSVFFNLVQNAIRHGKQTTHIRLFCQESFEELHVVCEDDGIGVPPEAKEKIFNREFFSQTGLQMYLAREILSITGISIRETGIYGTGACFELRVPKGGYRFILAQQ